MKFEEVRRLVPGLYCLSWKSGGESLACVGMLYSGNRWYACANWTLPDGDGIPGGYTEEDWDKVKSATKVLSN